MVWRVSDLDKQAGRTVVVTGGNSGIGLEAAKALAQQGARVIIASRDVTRAAEAADVVRTASGSQLVETATLDLSSLASVRACAKDLSRRCERLDVLVNNAGVMAIPRRDTEDGFETQFATNHLGHFALTALLFPRLAATPGARIVTVSSLAHHFGFINFFNLHGRLFYDPFLAYAQSKLANLLFTYELDRRCRAAGVDVMAVACHPGIAATNLPYASSRMLNWPLGESLVRTLSSIVSQSAAEGALPTLYAGFAAHVQGGDYIGPDGPGETRGSPRKVQSSFVSRAESVARQLWDVSEEATKVKFTVASLPD